MCSRLVGQSRPRDSNTLLIDPVQRTFREALVDDEVSTTSDTEDGWSVLDDTVDEISHLTAKNGRKASGARVRDGTFVTTTEWLLAIAHLDFEPTNRNQNLLIPIETPRSFTTAYAEGAKSYLNVIEDYFDSPKYQSNKLASTQNIEAHHQPAKLRSLRERGSKSGEWLKELCCSSSR